MKRPRVQISDVGLSCFVQWCRLNPEWLVADVEVAQNVLRAYARMTDPEPEPIEAAPI